ncbi:MAG: hypothetical protein SGPRY_014943, partial [Prymnesium sp.]
MARIEAESSGECSAVFQADFLQVQLIRQKELTLQSVVNGLCIENAGDPGISFTTAEYGLTADSQHLGISGNFVPSLNPAFNSSDMKSVIKFLRHQNVCREMIKLYNVEVTAVKLPETETTSARTAVRISPDDPLLRLAAACPAAPQQPREAYTGGVLGKEMCEAVRDEVVVQGEAAQGEAVQCEAVHAEAAVQRDA